MQIITVFVLGYLSTAILIVYGKALAIVTKRPIVDVARVLNPCQYELTWIGYRNNLIQVLMEGNNWSTWVQCITVIFDFEELISINKDAIDWWSWILTEHKVVIRLSSVKKWGILLNIVRIISNDFKVSLRNSFPVVQEKKWPVKSLITENSGRTKDKTWWVKICLSTDRYFDPCRVYLNTWDCFNKLILCTFI